MKLDAILFDLDGLLLDTETHSLRAFKATTDFHDLGDQTDFFLSMVGTNEANHVKRITEEFGHHVDMQTFRQTWLDNFHNLMSDEPPAILPGVIDLLTYAQQENIKCAVATSSGTTAAIDKLETADLIKYFSTITCGDQVENSKPFPEIYLKAGASIDADMTRTLALEDSDNGVRAAVAANLSVIQVPNLVPACEVLKQQLGHKVSTSLHSVLQEIKDGTALYHT